MKVLILSSKWFSYLSTLKNSFHKVKFLTSSKVLHQTLNLAYARLMLGMESHTFNLCRFKFSFLYGNVISYLERIRDGKFPHSWLSSHSKKKFPHSRLRRSWGNFLSLFLLSHSWGNYFSCIRGFATHTGKIPSLILSR